MPRLTEGMVRAARHLARSRGTSARQLAREFGVEERTMQHAVYGSTWTHLPGALDSGQKELRRLTEDEARAILASSEPSPKVAERYGIAASTVRHLRTGRTWGHLPRPDRDEARTA